MLCVECHINEVMPRYIRCKDCRLKANKPGICSLCNAAPCMPFHRQCRECLNQQKRKGGKIGAKRTRLQCSDCGSTEIQKGSMCNECNQKHNNLRKALRRMHAPPAHGRCAICEEVRPLCLDHNHATCAFRGYLCTHCNVMLGMADENPLVMAKAIGYLRAARDEALTLSSSV
jgi:hypothetical protein